MTRTMSKTSTIKILSWGRGKDGQLGSGQTADQVTPKEVWNEGIEDDLSHVSCVRLLVLCKMNVSMGPLWDTATALPSQVRFDAFDH